MLRGRAGGDVGTKEYEVEADVADIQKLFENIDADYDNAATTEFVPVHGEEVFHDFDSCDVIVLNDPNILNLWVLARCALQDRDGPRQH